MITYRIPVYGYLDEILPSAQEVVGFVNDAMERFGFDEKIKMRSLLFEWVISFDTIQTLEEMNEIRTTMQLACDEDEKSQHLGLEISQPNEWEMC